MTPPRVAEMFYPIMLTQAMGEISEAKACELMGMDIEAYRDLKAGVAASILCLLEELPSPLTLLLDAIPGKPALSRKTRSS